MLLFVGLLLADGHGWTGFAILLVAALLVGLLMGLVGRRYPRIYSQNRRDRRREAE